MQGVVKFYNSEKGFGFIATNSDNFFFHISDVTGLNSYAIAIGCKVEFEEGIPNNKGRKAKNVTVLEKGTQVIFIDLVTDNIRADSILSYSIKNVSESFLQPIKEYDDKIAAYQSEERHNRELSSKAKVPSALFMSYYTAENNSVMKNRYVEKRNLYISRTDDFEKKYKLAIENNLYCLRIITHQGKKYYFYNECCGFNIWEKYNEIKNTY